MSLTADEVKAFLHEGGYIRVRNAPKPPEEYLCEECGIDLTDEEIETKDFICESCNLKKEAC